MVIDGHRNSPLAKQAESPSTSPRQSVAGKHEIRRDTVELSNEGVKQGRRTDPPIRADRVAAVREQLESGAYTGRKMIEKVVDRLLESLGI